MTDTLDIIRIRLACWIAPRWVLIFVRTRLDELVRREQEEQN